MKKLFSFLVVLSFALLLSSCTNDTDEQPMYTQEEVDQMIEDIRAETYSKEQIDEMFAEVNQRNDNQDDAILFLAEKVQDLFSAIIN